MTTEKKYTIVVVGNPNVGKSTLYNQLVNGKQEITNAPGTTVAIEKAVLDTENHKSLLIDLPGTYSLLPISPDEQITSDVVLGKSKEYKPDLILYIHDITHFSASLYLLAQLKDLDIPILLVNTKIDLIDNFNIDFDESKLAELLSIDVVSVNSHSSESVDKVKEAIDKKLFELDGVESGDAESIATNSAEVSRIDNSATDNTDASKIDNFATDNADTSKIENSPASKDGGASDHSPSAVKNELKNKGDLENWIRKNSDSHFRWVASIEAQMQKIRTDETREKLRKMHKTSENIDKVLLHPFFGSVIFLAVMFCVFQLTQTIALPIGEWISDTLDPMCENAIHNVLAQLSLSGGWPESFMINGLLNGVITVLTFIPPVLIMFLLITALQESGYLARVAFIADKVMRFLGLDGRSVLPLIVGFSCNLPSYVAIRTIPDQRHRELTAYLVPFTLCNARMAIFMVLAAVIFPSQAGVVMFCLYLSSILLILIVGLILHHSPMFKDIKSMPFIISLPDYQSFSLPRLGKNALNKTMHFVKSAGKIIIAAIVIIWGLQSVPAPGSNVGFNDLATGKASIEQSVYGAVSQAVTPVFKPLGFGDWRITASVASGFVAKEIVVGSLNETFEMSASSQNNSVASQGNSAASQNNSVAQGDSNDKASAGGNSSGKASAQGDSTNRASEQDNAVTEDSADASSEKVESVESTDTDEINNGDLIVRALDESSNGKTGLAGFAFLLFLLAYTPCVATVVEASRQLSKKFAIKSVLLTFSTAYIVSLLVFQIGSLFF